MPRDEVTAVLKQLLEGKGRQTERSIKNRFAAWRRGLRADPTDASRRTLGELRDNAAKAQGIRMEKQKRDRKRREMKRRKDREGLAEMIGEITVDAYGDKVKNSRLQLCSRFF